MMDKEENLRLASRDGDIEKVKRLVKEGAHPNGCDQHGNTSFHWCCMSDNCPVEVLSFLVSSSSTSVSLSNIRNNDGSTPMHLAFICGNLELIKYIYKTDTSSMTECDYNDKMPVHYTTQNTEILSFVISVLESSNIEVYKRIKIAAWCCMCVEKSFLNVPGSFSTLKHLIVMMTFRSFLSKFVKEEHKEFVEFIIGFEKLRFYDICTPFLHELVKQGDVAKVAHFVDKIGWSINTRNEDGNTLLHVACYNNHFAIVELLTKHEECYIETRNHNRRSALHIAAQHGHLQIVKHLVESKQCDTNMKDIYLDTPLHLACLNGHLNVVAYLSAPEICSNIEERGWNGFTLVYLAASNGQTEILKFLIEQRKCDVNSAVETTGVTPLHLACYAGNVDVVEYLSDNELCDINAETRNGKKALYFAAEQGHIKVVKHLVERKGCDINIKSNNNNTLLHEACYAGHLDIVEYLVNNESCDIDAKDLTGRHGLHFAAEQGLLEVLKYLVERKGCDVNLMDGNNDTPLHLACSNVHFSEHNTDTGHLDTVKYLISNELCDINAKDGKGRTVAHLVSQSGSLDVLKILFERGCSLTGDEDGNTPLHYACSRKEDTSLDNASNINLIKFLVSQPDCNIDEVNKDGEHVLHILCKYDSDPNIIKYLISEKQCSVNVFDSHGNHPLHLACKALNIEHVIALTCSPNCDVDVINHLNGRQHSLHILCETKSNDIAVEIAVHLIKKKQCNLNVCNENGYTPLGLACKARNLEMVMLLTDETRCNINEGIHPLRIIYSHHWNRGDCWYVGFYLLMNKPSCDVNVQHSDGNTVLHLACDRGNHTHYKMVERLISHPKCDINILNNNNMNPLLLVTRSKGNSTSYIVELLVKTNKCDVNIRDIDGNTPLHYLCEWLSPYALPSVKSLTDSPVCDINAENNEGVRPIHLAAKHGSLQVVYHLVNSGCDVTAKDKSGKTPMDYSTSTKVKDFLSYVVYGTPYMLGNSKDEALLYHNIKRDQALKQDGYTMLKVTKCILTGPPGAGKSTLKKRLLNESLGDDLSTGVVNAAVQVDSFRKLDQQGVIVPNINEDSNLEWRKQDVDEEAVFLINTIAEPISNITDSENDETSSTDSENDETSDDLHSVSVDTEDHQNISQNDEISTAVIHKRTEQCQLRVKTTPAAVEAIEDHRSPSNSDEHVDQSQSEIDKTIKPMEVRSHLHETLEQDSTTHDDDLKTKAITEISKAVEKIPFYKKQQYISNTQNISKDDHAVLQIIDTGGQPEFHEILPTLITGPAVNILVFKLTEDLQGRYPITYRSSDGNSDPYLTSLTHEEVIFRSLSSIACLRYNTVGWNFDHDEVPVKDDSEPAAFLIATHRDCVDDDKVDTVNDQLKHRIQSSAELFTENLIQFSAPDKPIFALDTTKDQKEIEDLRKSLHNVINTNFQDIKVPVSWCALSLKLKRRKSLYTYQTCFKLAKESGIKDEDDFKAVLWFLHNRAGAIMYYPDVKGLEDIIITNIQLVFDRITELMTSCFTFKNVGPSAEEEFDTMGMFTESDIRKLSKRKGDPLTPKRLVALLKYLHIVAGPLKTKVGRSTKISYFMPCALKPADIENEHRNETSTPAPLLIWFECGYCPVGVYCCLVVYLLSLSQQTELKWELANPPHYRNKISFIVGKQYDRVTILSRATYIEVWVDQAQEFKDRVRLKIFCQNVRTILNQGINAVTKTLHYSYNSRHYFGFPCCSSPSSCLPPHPAVCEYEEPVAAKCVLNKDTMKLKDIHSIWFQEVPPLSTEDTVSISNIDQSDDSALTMSLGEEDLDDVCEMLSDCVDWFGLGVQLGLKYSRLREIEIERQRNVQSCRIDMIASWLGKEDKVIKKGGPTWKQLIEALRVINEIGLGEKIYEKITKQQKVSNPVKSDNDKEEMTSKVKQKRIESSFDSHESSNMKKRRLESSDSDSELEYQSDYHSNHTESDNRIIKKRSKRRKDKHVSRSKKQRMDLDERSVASKVRGKGPASGKPYKRKRVPKNTHDKSDSESEHDDSDSEPSSKRTHKR